MSTLDETPVMPAASAPQPRRGKSTKAAGDQVAAPSALGSVPPAVQLIPLALLDDNPANPRDAIGDVDELAASIRSVGLLEPIIVAPAHLHRAAAGEVGVVDAGRYVVIAGHRRKAACELAPIDPVPCLVRGDLVGGRDEDAMLIENLHREDLTPLEEARGYQRLIDRGLSQRDVADRVGRNQSHISKRIALLKLPEVARDAVVAGDIPLAEAVAIASVADRPEVFEQAWQLATRNGVAAQVAVSTAIRTAELAAAKAEAIAELQANGARVYDGYLQSYEYGGNPVLLSVLTPAVRKKHDTLPCHVAAIGRDGSVTWGCDKPKNHKAKQPSESAKAKAAREAAAAAATQAREDRLEVAIRLLVAKKPSKDVESYGLAWVVQDLLGNMGDAVTVSALLGLQVDTSNADDRYPHTDAIEAYAARGTAEALRVIAALALDDAESNYSWRQDESYEQLLIANGWTKPAEAT